MKDYPSCMISKTNWFELKELGYVRKDELKGTPDERSPKFSIFYLRMDSDGMVSYYVVEDYHYNFIYDWVPTFSYTNYDSSWFCRKLV